MPPTPSQIDPESPQTETGATQNGSSSNDLDTQGSKTETVKSDAPLSFVPHEKNGQAAAAPARIRTSRYGELEEHELIRLLDTINDDRARARFRESIYISVFVWMAIAWVAFYGPKYLWHAPQLISPTEALQQQAIVKLNAPVLPHHKVTPPKLDKETLEKIREMELKRKPSPAEVPAATPQPEAKQPPPPAASATEPKPPVPAPALPLPAAPTPRAAAPVPEAPKPQPESKPTFNTPASVSKEMQQAMQGSEHANSAANLGVHGTSKATSLGQGVDILSDTQGVNFQPYLQRILREIYEQWMALIPEEARPPLNKQGTTLIRFTINPDGTIAAMNLDGSTHDDALNRAAWGSITGVGQFPPLPKEFHGPNLELRIHYLVNEPTDQR